MTYLHPEVEVIATGDVGVLVIRKNASSSMQSARERIVDTYEDLPPELHVFVREPIQRLYSAYRFFGKQPVVFFREEARDYTWEEFVDGILDKGYDDMHWRPVSKTIELLGRPVIPHLFEKVNEEYMLGDLPIEKSSPLYYDADLSYREDDLREYYQGDYALREEARER